MKTVKIGLIGVGVQGEQQLRCFKTIENAEVIAISDVNEKRAKEVAETYKIRGVYPNFDDLVADQSIDMVSVCTPDHLHVEPSIASIESDKHLLVEKPLATNVPDAEKIVNEANRRGLKLMLNFSNRWSPPFKLAKKAIDEGKLGQPIHAYSRLSDTIYVPTEMIRWSDKTNVLWFLGSHVFDLLRWFFGDEAKSVFAASRSIILKGRGIRTPDFYQAMIEFRAGGVAVMENSWILPKGEPFVVDFKMDVFGEKGAIRIDRSHHGSLKMVTEDRTEFPDVYVLTDEKTSSFVRDGLESFVRCVAEDTEPPVGGEDGLAVTKAISSMIRSAEAGLPVTLE